MNRKPRAVLSLIGFFIAGAAVLYPAHARISVAAFPMVNKTDNEIYNWVAYALPELCSRAFLERPRVQVWDPVLLAADDNLTSIMESESLLVNHQKRWIWDLAIGGEYDVVNDTIVATLKIVKSSSKGLERSQRQIRAPLAGYFSVLRSAIMPMVATNDTTGQSMIVDAPSLNAWATYCAGFAFEMTGENENAITAYIRSRELASEWSFTSVRLAIIYQKAHDAPAADKCLTEVLKLSNNAPWARALKGKYLADFGSLAQISRYIETYRSDLEKSALGLTVLGAGFSRKGEYSRAISLFTRAVAFGPSDLEPDFLLGNTYFTMGQFSTATDVFNRLVNSRPNYVRYYASLGAAYRDLGRHMESSRILENALALDSKNTTILISLAHTYFNLGWYEKAQELLEQAYALNPSMNESLMNLGVLYWHMGRRNFAEKIFAQAEGNPGLLQASLNNRANALLYDGKIKDAIRLYRQAMGIGTKSENILANLGTALENDHHIGAAIDCYEEVLRLAPARTDIRLRLAMLAIRQGNDDQAESHLRTIMEEMPYNEGALLQLVAVQKKHKKYTEATDYLERFLELYPNNKETRFLLARTYEEEEWWDVAAMRYEELSTQYASDGAAFIGLGRSLFEAMKKRGHGDVDRIIYVLKHASELLVHDPQPDYLIGNLYWDKNYAELAIDHWKRAYSRATDAHLRTEIKSALAQARVTVQ